MNDPHARYPFSVRFHHGGRCMRGGDFVGSMLWGFKFQIEIGDLDFETGIWAETYHNWAKIDDAGSPWIHGPRQSSNMLIGSIRREEFITGLILGWFLIFLGGGLIWTQTYSMLWVNAGIISRSHFHHLSSSNQTPSDRKSPWKAILQLKKQQDGGFKDIYFVSVLWNVKICSTKDRW